MMSKYDELKRLAHIIDPIEPDLLGDTYSGHYHSCVMLTAFQDQYIAFAYPAIILELITENERLNSCLKWEQHRAERIGTHGSGCESWGPGHYECLLRERDQLRVEVEALRKDAERYRLVRRLSPRQFDAFWSTNVKTGQPFDDLIDAMIKEGRDER